MFLVCEMELLSLSPRAAAVVGCAHKRAHPARKVYAALSGAKAGERAPGEAPFLPSRTTRHARAREHTLPSPPRLTRRIQVDARQQGLHLRPRDGRPTFSHSGLQLVHRDGARPVGVDLLKQDAQARNLFGRHAARDDFQGLLLQLVHAGKAAQAGEDDIVQGRVPCGPVLLHPVVLEDRVGSRAHARVLGQHLADAFLGGLRDGGPGVGRQVQVALEDGVKDLLLRLPPKGRHAGQEDVEDHAARPDVRLRPVRPAQDLRRDVVGRTDNVGEYLAGLVKDGQPEVGGLQGGVVRGGGEQEVFGFQVAVDDAQRVAVRDDADDRPHQPGRILFGQVALGDDAVKQLAPRAQLHDQVDAVLVLVRAFQGDDRGRACQVVHDLDFPLDVLHILRRRQLALGDGLAGQLGAGRLFRGQAGRPELAAPEDAAQSVDGRDVLF